MICRRPNNGTTPEALQRRGSLLAQMVVVMSCMSILITLNGTLLFRLFRQQSEMTVATVQAAVCSRLARDFRNDVHQAAEIRRIGDDERSLELTVESGTIIWQIDGDTVRRVHLPADTQKTLNNSPGERYHCLDCSVSFTLVEAEGQSTLAQLQLAPAGSPTATASTIRILSSLGLARRHEGGPVE